MSQWLTPNTYKFLWYVNFADVTNPEFLQFSCEVTLPSNVLWILCTFFIMHGCCIIDAHMAWLKVSCSTSSSIWSRTLPLMYWKDLSQSTIVAVDRVRNAKNRPSRINLPILPHILSPVPNKKSRLGANFYQPLVV